MTSKLTTILPDFKDIRFKRYSKVAVDLARLHTEAHALLLDYPNGKLYNQRSLQTDGSTDWDSGTGSQPGVNEAIWDKLHPGLIGTWWEEFFASFPYKLYRSRLMVIQPRTCYSIHSDLTPRIHIAIDTHPQARFIFTNPAAVVHIPADGYAWWVDTRQEHTALNGSLKPRIHFVACLDNTDPN
jgi:hypothetical protein